jgi:hypothetical protein
MAEPKNQLIDTIMTAIATALSNVHTATIAKVTGVNGSTINCQPVIARLVDGVSIPLPEFVDVPVLTLQGGGSYTAYPAAIGDYCLLLFAERCFDRWYAGQDGQPPLELRMHDYSDGIAIVGVNPLSSAILIPTTIKQVGDTVQEGDYTHTGDFTMTGDFILTGDLNVTGNIICSGNIAAASFSGPMGGPMVASGDITTTGDVVAGTISLKSHTHPVTTAPGTTGAPT